VESALYVFEALLLVEELEQWISTWAKSPPRGDFVIYEIWGASSVSRGRFLQVKTYSDVELIPKNQYLLLWNQSHWCTFDSMVGNKAYITHIGPVTHHLNSCNMVLWNASLYQLSKTTDIVTGWESSIAVLTKIIGQPIFWPKNLKFWL